MIFYVIKIDKKLHQFNMLLQSITLKKYPAEMSLSSLICLVGAMQTSVVAVVAERHSGAGVWALGWDFRLYGPLYTVPSPFLTNNFISLVLFLFLFFYR